MSPPTLAQAPEASTHASLPRDTQENFGSKVSVSQTALGTSKNFGVLTASMYEFCAKSGYFYGV
jgi:hypothetical protein